MTSFGCVTPSSSWETEVWNRREKRRERMGRVEPTLALPQSWHSLGWSRTKARSHCCLSELRLCCSYLIHGDLREIHLSVTMEKFCRQTADKWPKGACTLQVKADPSSVSPAMGILLFRLQLETRNKSVHRNEAVQGKAASVSKQPRLRMSYTTLSVQMALQHTDQKPGTPGGRGASAFPDAEGLPSTTHLQQRRFELRVDQEELGRITPDGHRNFGKCLSHLCKHNRSR